MPLISSAGLSRSTLRKQLRQLRRNLPPCAQRQAALSLYKQLSQNPCFRRAKHIALYIAADGEIDPIYLLKAAQQRGKQVYLPVLRRWPKGRMDFQPFKPKQKLSRNRFGIAEPRPNSASRRPLWALDLLLLPLVGFDKQGGRLGMGGGFYDRSLSYLKRRTKWHSPHRFGLAHQCQQVDHLLQASWDVPMNGIFTSSHYYHCN